MTYRRNDATNPSFQTNTTEWTAIRGTLSRVAGPGSGQWVGSVSTTSTGGNSSLTLLKPIPLRSGVRAVTISYDVKDTGVVGTQMSWRSSAGDNLSGQLYAPNVTTAGAWTRVSFTFSRPADVPPAGAVSFMPIVALRLRAVGDVFQVDRVLIEQHRADEIPTTAPAYFDGSEAPGDDLVQWTGPDHASTSVLVDLTGTALLARLPWRAESGAGFTLNTSRLGYGILNDILTGFTLDTSHLDTDGLAAPSVGVWVPITDEGVSISWTRGVNTSGLLPKAEPGTLTASFLDGIDPAALSDLRQGQTPIRLYHDTRPLWTGRVDRFSVTWDKDGSHYRTTLTALDVVPHLDGILAGPYLSDHVGPGQIRTPDQQNPQTFINGTIRSRFARLLDGLDGVEWRKQGTGVVSLWNPAGVRFDEVEQKSVAAHLDEAAGSLLGMWWVDALGVVVIGEDDPDDEAVLVFSDTYTNPGGTPPVVSFVEGSATWSTERVVTELELTRTLNGVLSNESTSTHTYADPTGRATWGAKRLTGFVVVDPDLLPPHLFRLRGAPAMSSGPLTVHGIPAADVGDAVTVDLRGGTISGRVAAIAGELRPGATPRITYTITERAV